MNGAQSVIESLKNHGTNIVFGYPGGAIMPVYDALYHSEIEHLLTRHEQAAAMAAIGYARATGKVGICIATSGPGATNLITGLADALLDSIPIIAITGQVGTNLIGTDAFQEIDVLGLSLSCTKHSFLVQTPEELPSILAQAFHLAQSGRPGPILIDIPKDIQTAEILNAIEAPIASEILPFPKEAIECASKYIADSKKPMLYIGGGVGMANAVPRLQNFLEATQIPASCTLKALGAIPTDYPYYLGMLGMHGTKAANLAVQECDLLIAIGARFDDRVTGKLSQFAPCAKIIHIDIDKAEFNKLRFAHCSIYGDLNAILPALQQKLSLSEWQNHVAKLKQDHLWHYDHKDEKISACAFLNSLSKLKPQSAIVTTDVGQHQMWAAQHLDHHDPKNFISSSGLGTMGFGLPAAIGAQISRPHDMVFCITGDGSFMMNIQELNTVKRKNLPLKIILLDNQRLGMVAQWQKLFKKDHDHHTDLSDNPDFLALARAFNIDGQHITHPNQIENALHTMLASKDAYFLHVSIDENENVWPLVPPGASNSDMLEDLS